MSGRQAIRFILVAAGVCATLPALGQNLSNVAWIGQVGTGNTLDITQGGRSNAAGADNLVLLLSQDGTGNDLTLDQEGYDNEVGTLFADVPEYARGVWQNGDLNQISVQQHNADPDGSNTIGAIEQSSSFGLTTGGANQLEVIQSEDGGADGAGGHYIGRLVQDNDNAAGADNIIIVTQTGGGLSQGNVLASLSQQGSGNLFTVTQTGQSNLFGENPDLGGGWQEGAGNDTWLLQDGTQNLVQYVEQYGTGNTARISLDGERNAVASVYQDNRNAGLDPNQAEITISGEDNGGTGSGGVGEFLAAETLAQTGVIQGGFRQYGAGNSLRLTITAGGESKYGITQDGDGNQAFVTMASYDPPQLAMRNETAIYQNGSLNLATHTILGNDNAGALEQIGRRNQARLSQTGDANLARISLKGDDNNANGSTLFGSALIVAMNTSDATPGTLGQSGQSNRMAFDIAGSFNGIVFSQSGDFNLIVGAMTGGSNALAVVQSNQSNTSLSSQTGSGNSLGILQY